MNSSLNLIGGNLNQTTLIQLIDQVDLDKLILQPERERIIYLLTEKNGIPENFTDKIILATWIESLAKYLEINASVSTSLNSQSFFSTFRENINKAMVMTRHQYVNICLTKHRPLDWILSVYSLIFGNKLVRVQPHYRIIDTIYKKLGGGQNPLVSVPLTFSLTHILFHELLPRSLNYIGYLLHSDPEKTTEAFDFTSSDALSLLIWTSLSLPIVYQKTRSMPTTLPENELPEENVQVLFKQN